MDEQQQNFFNNQVKELLEQNLALTKEIYEISKKLHKHLIWQKITSIVYIIIIVLPLILSLVFLPKIFNTYLSGIMPAGANQMDLLKDVIQNRQQYFDTLK